MSLSESLAAITGENKTPRGAVSFIPSSVFHYFAFKLSRFEKMVSAAIRAERDAAAAVLPPETRISPLLDAEWVSVMMTAYPAAITAPTFRRLTDYLFTADSKSFDTLFRSLCGSLKTRASHDHVAAMLVLEAMAANSHRRGVDEYSHAMAARWNNQIQPWSVYALYNLRKIIIEHNGSTSVPMHDLETMWREADEMTSKTEQQPLTYAEWSDSETAKIKLESPIELLLTRDETLQTLDWYLRHKTNADGAGPRPTAALLLTSTHACQDIVTYALWNGISTEDLAAAFNTVGYNALRDDNFRTEMTELMTRQHIEVRDALLLQVRLVAMWLQSHDPAWKVELSELVQHPTMRTALQRASSEARVDEVASSLITLGYSPLVNVRAAIQESLRSGSVTESKTTSTATMVALFTKTDILDNLKWQLATFPATSYNNDKSHPAAAILLDNNIPIQRTVFAALLVCDSVGEITTVFQQAGYLEATQFDFAAKLDSMLASVKCEPDVEILALALRQAMLIHFRRSSLFVRRVLPSIVDDSRVRTVIQMAYNKMPTRKISEVISEFGNWDVDDVDMVVITCGRGLRVRELFTEPDGRELALPGTKNANPDEKVEDLGGDVQARTKNETRRRKDAVALALSRSDVHILLRLETDPCFRHAVREAMKSGASVNDIYSTVPIAMLDTSAVQEMFLDQLEAMAKDLANPSAEDKAVDTLILQLQLKTYRGLPASGVLREVPVLDALNDAIAAGVNIDVIDVIFKDQGFTSASNEDYLQAAAVYAKNLSIKQALRALPSGRRSRKTTKTAPKLTTKTKQRAKR